MTKEPNGVEENVRDLLGLPASDDSLRELMINAEMLWRMWLAEEPPTNDAPSNQTLWHQYLDHLAKHPLTWDVHRESHEILADLKLVRRQPFDQDDLLDLLQDLDDCLMCGRGLERQGRLGHDELLQLAARVSTAVRQHARWLKETFDYALRRSQVIADDDEYPGLYGFWDDLAFLVPEIAVDARMEAQQTPQKLAQLQARLAKQPEPKVVPIPSMPKWPTLPEIPDILRPPPISLPNWGIAACFSSAATASMSTTLLKISDPELAKVVAAALVEQEGGAIVRLVATEPHRLKVERAKTKDGREMGYRTVSDHEIEVELSKNDPGEFLVVLHLDDHRIELPFRTD